MKKSTYTRRSVIVSTVKKSQASTLAACWRRNCRQLGPERLGAGPKTVGKQDPPDRARRHTQAELQQLAGDPRVAPTWVLTREAEHELSHPTVGRRTARTSSRLRPLPTHKLPVPAQERLWRHHQSVAPGRREQSGERRQQCAISRPQQGSSLLPSEHGQLVPQHE
jgi:hypothetical protein